MISSARETAAGAFSGLGNGVAAEQVQAESSTDSDLPMLSRLFGEQGGDGAPARADAAGLLCAEDLPACAEGIAAAENFVEGGVRGPEAYDNAGTAGWGWWDVSYDPKSGEDGVQHVAMRVGVNFLDSLEFDGETATAINGMSQDEADWVNSLDEELRLEAAQEYMWNSDDHAEWMSDLETLIETRWGSEETGFSFFVNQEGWEWVGADVEVDLDVQALDTPQALGGGPTGDRHMVVDALKVPNGMGASSAVNSNANMLLASTDLQVRADAANLLGPFHIFFGHDSASLDADAQADLDWIIETLNGAPDHEASQAVSMALTGHASGSGSATYNERLGLRRVEAVAAYLRGGGFSNLDERVESSSEGSSQANTEDRNDPFDRRVTIAIDGDTGQIVATHEFGHAFGLDDEYSGICKELGEEGECVAWREAGDVTDDHDNVRNMTDASGQALPGSITENSTSLMSWGNTILPQHYVTFKMGLEQVTEVSPWSLGEAHAKADVLARCASLSPEADADLVQSSP